MKNVIIAVIFSLMLVIVGVFSNTYLMEFTEFDKYIYYGFPVLAFILNFIFIYLILKVRRKLPENSDYPFLLIVKQFLNGIALVVFICNALGNTLFLHFGKSEIKDFCYLSILLILFCIALVLLNKNINEYLKLVLFSEIIIVFLNIVQIFVYNMTFSSGEGIRNYYLANLLNSIEYLIRILNILLPMVFYLLLTRKRGLKKRHTS